MTANKRTQRLELHKKRVAQSAQAIESSSKRVCQQLQQLLQSLKPRNLALYAAIEGEIDPLCPEIVNNPSYACYLPKMVNQQLQFFNWQPHEALVAGSFGIAEPNSSLCIDCTDLDVVILPLIGFDLNGHRLGRGAGHYDCAFEFLRHSPRHTKPYLVGVAYHWQQLAEPLAHDEWDVPLNAVVTDQQIFVWNNL